MRLRARVTDIGLLTGLARRFRTDCRDGIECFTTILFAVYARSLAADLPERPRRHPDLGDFARGMCGSYTQSTLFTEYRVESNRNNEVTLEVATEALARVLRSAAGALDLVLRLGKRNGEPLLSMAIAMSSHSGARLDVTQDILIRILRTSELNLITEPMCPPPDVCVTTLTPRYILRCRRWLRCALLQSKCGLCRVKCALPQISRAHSAWLCSTVKWWVTRAGRTWKCLGCKVGCHD